jgi:hypothetical protein
MYRLGNLRGKVAARHIHPKTSREISVARKAFGFDTHGATVYVVRHGGKLRLLRVPKLRFFEGVARTCFLEHCIFHELFPENSIAPVALEKVEVQTNKGFVDKWCMVSEILKGRHMDYKRYHEWFYRNAKEPGKKPLEAAKHEEFVSHLPKSIFNELYDAGVDIQGSPANIVNVNGMPVFLEVKHISPNRVRVYAQRFPAERRQKIEQLLQEFTDSLPK